jgi:hypothetical protein
MDVISLIWINIISIALIFLLFIMWKTLRKQFPQPILFDLVAYFVALKLVLYFFLPAFLRMLSDWKYDRMINAAPSEIATVYTIEFISYVIWILSILIITQMPWFKRMAKKAKDSIFNWKESDKINEAGPNKCPYNFKRRLRLEGKPIFLNRNAKLFFLSICGLYLLFFPYSFDLSLQSEGVATYFIKPAVMMAGPVIGLYIISLNRKHIGNLLFALGIIVSLLSLIYGFGTGARGEVVWMGMWLFFLYFFVSRKKLILYTVIIGFATIAIFQSVMLEVRGRQDFHKMSPIEQISTFFSVKGLKSERDNLLSSMELRFGEASRLSVAFVRLHDSENAAGWRPIISALYAPLPRKFFPEKPEPGSIDGTKQGMGMYIIHDVMTGDWWNMSDFFTGVHSYWELGMAGVLLFSIVPALFISFCANYFARFGVAGLPFMMIMLFPQWNEPKLWISQIILQIFHILLPLMLIWYVTKIISRLRIKHVMKQANI